MGSKFQISINGTYHLSVGAVVFNEKGQVLTNYHDEFGGVKNFYLLMRETLENDETLEAAVIRGCREEFGVEVEIIKYLGGRITTAPRFNNTDHRVDNFEKTTIYFMCRMVRQIVSGRQSNDPETVHSQLKWMDPQKLIAIMKTQEERIGLDDANESSAVERALQFRSEDENR